jgi:predicted RNA-binding Zn-ribbon protein involved in translation (DUF1610 family)
MAVSKDDALLRYARTVGSVVKQSESKVASECKTIAPTVTLIYWPVWFLSDNAHDQIRTAEFDAVSGRLIREIADAPPARAPLSSSGGEAPRLSPHRCPDCGFDLTVSTSHAVFPCGNCGTLVAHESCGRRTVVRASYAVSGDDDHSRWYPFWGFDHNRVLVPAFAIRNYRLLVRFGAVISGQARVYTGDKPERISLEGTTLHQDIARGLAGLIRLRRPGPLHHRPDQNLAADSTEGSGSSDSPALIYAPLRSAGSELVDPITGLCLTRAALATP